MEPDYNESKHTTQGFSTTSKPTWTWYRNQSYEFYRYTRDEENGMMKKVYDDPHLQQQNNERKKVQMYAFIFSVHDPRSDITVSGNNSGKKGILNNVGSGETVTQTLRKSTPVSFEPLQKPPKYFMEGRSLPFIESGVYGPTKLETSNFSSKDSTGITAWHYSQSPHDLDHPLENTPTPPKLGTIYIHRNTIDGGYQVWVWLLQGDREAWQPVDLNGNLVHHPDIPSRVLTMQGSTGNPSWVLLSTLTTNRGRQLKKTRSRSRQRSPHSRTGTSTVS
ncbi:hypothetical protein EV360DRAFT_87006 [Lentinula raphanica]|nr:hypothetical protein EV360DRAFT_87006 [Lentinula raphanica]